MSIRTSESVLVRNVVARIIAGVAVVTATMLLAGCGGIPLSGSVNAGEAFTDQPNGDFVFNPLDPAKDADRVSILNGFIAAFTGSQSDYQVARKFLTTEFSKEWDPRNSVLIRTGSPTITEVDESTMDYTFTTKAQLDEFGAYSRVGPATQTLEFTLVKENGQWRISQAPPGIVLPESTFLSIFSKHALYFYDLSLTSLVPDERWFLGGATATRIVSALLVGPPEWLKGAVISQFPDGTQLTPGTTVSIESTEAQVDLTAEAAGASERQRQLMQLQLSQSLATVPGIASVEISVSGSTLNINPLGVNAPLVQRTVDSRAVVELNGAFGYLSGGEVTTIPGLSDRIMAVEPRAVALGVDAMSAAVLGADGVYLVRSGTLPKRVDGREGLIAPAIDDFGFVWSVTATDPGSLTAFGVDGNAHPVVVPLPVGASIVAFAIAQDNTRIAMLLQTAAGPRVIVAAITRDASQNYQPTGIGVPVLDSMVDSDIAVDVTWADSFAVATLSSTDGSSLVTSFEVGGERTSLGRPAESVEIAPGNTRTGLHVLGVDGHIQSQRGSSWQAGTTEVGFIAKQR